MPFLIQSQDAQDILALLVDVKADAHVKAYRQTRWIEERREMTRQAWAGVVAAQAKMFEDIRARRELSHEDKLAIAAADPYALYRAPLVRA